MATLDNGNYSYRSKIDQFPKQGMNINEYIYWGIFKNIDNFKICFFFCLMCIKVFLNIVFELFPLYNSICICGISNNRLS